jgi:phage recombination protein Bet
MPKGVGEIDERQWRVLCESIFPSAKTPEAIVLALDYCRARSLDPFKRPVNIVPMWNSQLRREVETVWPGINEVQITAARTGAYAGMDEPKWGPDVHRVFEGMKKWKDDDGKWKEEQVKQELTFPEWCSVTVYRMVDGQRCAFTEPVYWLEAYATQGKTNVPNAMWSKRPRGQVLKVAKAFSLRAAFPESGEYTAEEMEGREIASGGVIIENTPSPAPPPPPPPEPDPTGPVFATPEERSTFANNVIASIRQAVTFTALDDLKALNGKKLVALREGDADDKAVFATIKHRFEARKHELTKAAGTIDDTPQTEQGGPDGTLQY